MPIVSYEFLAFYHKSLDYAAFTRAIHTCACNYIHGRNNFVEVSKNLARYESENNFVSSK